MPWPGTATDSPLDAAAGPIGIGTANDEGITIGNATPGDNVIIQAAATLQASATGAATVTAGNVLLKANVSDGLQFRSLGNTNNLSWPESDPDAGSYLARDVADATKLAWGALGAGVRAALAVDIGSSGAFVVQDGVLGTPLSGTLTNCTGLPIVAGTTGTLSILRGGTGQTTQQAAIDALTAVSGATTGHVLTKDGSGNATFQAAPGAGGGMAIGGTVTGGTAGSILYVGSGPVLAQDNDTLFWDPINNLLGVGTNAPKARLHVETAYGAVAVNDSNSRFLLNVDLNNNPSIELHRGKSGFNQADALFIDWAWADDSDFNVRWIMQSATKLLMKGPHEFEASTNFAAGSTHGPASQSVGGSNLSVRLNTNTSGALAVSQDLRGTLRIGTPAAASIPADAVYVLDVAGAHIFRQSGSLVTAGTEMFRSDRNRKFGITQSSPATRLHVTDTDSGTSAVVDTALLEHNSSGTPASGFGGSLQMRLHSSTNTSRDAGKLEFLWNDPTDATRKADLVLCAYDTAKREGLRIRGGGSAVAVGIYGVTPVARATTGGAASTFTANTSGIADDTATWDSYTIGQVVKALRNVGILT